MRWSVTACMLAACSFPGSQGAPGDAPEVPDEPDADVTVPDARPVSNDGRPPDATPPIDAANPPDAALIDATPVFARDLCPPEYDWFIDGYDTSYYRPILTLGNFATQHADCNDDTGLSWTHLLVPDATEVQAWGGAFDSGEYFYIGAVQDPSATTLAGGWVQFDGGPITAPWSGNGSQPDDDNGSESGQENLAISTSGGTLHDVAGATAYFAVCECDGTPILESVAAMLP